LIAVLAAQSNWFIFDIQIAICKVLCGSGKE
jgi:hypothetical protein